MIEIGQVYLKYNREVWRNHVLINWDRAKKMMMSILLLLSFKSFKMLLMSLCSIQTKLCDWPFKSVGGGESERYYELTNSFKLWPAEKTFPLALKTIALKDLSSLFEFIASMRYFIISNDSEFLHKNGTHIIEILNC